MHQCFSFPGFFLDDQYALLRKGADSTRVCRCPDVHSGSGAVGSVTGEQVTVLLKGKVGQLVKCNEVISLALVLGPVLGVLHSAEDDLGAAWECPCVAGAVVFSLGIGSGVVVEAFVDQLCQLREGLPQDQRLVVGDMHLPQGFNDDGVTLAAARSAAVQGLSYSGRIMNSACFGCGFQMVGAFTGHHHLSPPA